MSTPRELFLRALYRQPTSRPATGSATSVVTADLMDAVGVAFPEAHLHAQSMADLAAAGHTVLGFDNVMPLYSVWHESAALGCPVNWGDRTHMPDSRSRIPMTWLISATPARLVPPNLWTALTLFFIVRRAYDSTCCAATHRGACGGRRRRGRCAV